MTGRRESLAGALNATLAELLDTDPRVLLIGQDIGRLGGVFRVTRGLQQRFGEERVRDAVLSESSIVGQAIGMSLSGLVPVCEIQFESFVYPAMNQLVTQAARMRTRWSGETALPLVVRIPAGGGIRGVEHHSESNEAYFAHTAGLTVAFPSAPADASAMLRHSCSVDSPVVFFEPKRLYWSRKTAPRAPAATGDTATGARIVRHGTDITVVTYGALVEDALAAAGLIADTIDVEILDLRWLAPLDTAAILDSVRRTGRLVVVHESNRFVGVGAEVLATVAEAGTCFLRAPMRRVAPAREVYPPADREAAHLVGVGDIVSAIKDCCA
ncbi:alpha-ketoacid dehydrogenase subunit beta [Millisia brevis]|uniref:alpha-ketoacid dehydrogenase subunit beta n=1 Tax=Millisia brevis TaxID=264148 RepID=UPI0008327B93|nr:transketolase C-terminal domain-containing protein [Millisia brevis]